MLPVDKRVREVAVHDGAIPDEMLRATAPYIVRGLAADWPLVRAARSSHDAADAYLRRFYGDATVHALLGHPAIAGRFFYNEALDGFNYQSVRARLDGILDELKVQATQERPGAIYVGSTTIDTALPGLRAENDVDLGGRDALASIWIGNRTRIAAHYDLPDNIAVVAAGHRRFTLFPPEQLANLYVGPIDFTPAGQPISMVDFHAPDWERFPRFRTALEHAQVAGLGPGDALFIPSMWWHHVEALDRFNILVNYWWRQSPDWMDTPTNSLMLALLTMRELPPAQRRAWQEIFRHYIFEPDEANLAHMPAQRRYALAPLDEDGARILRGQVLKRINR
ncbi:cupin-like domain-containing protein [Massilia sp. YIM B02763]|uniref:cupin-like domain-containing protein n=1 Tax=Massilia sp. YIM B02763 TaxID=3050130 RepID=UPI0025B71E36|nr:cupin-like domain-containing protein [Massilia sp. YIM B02763]MDN4051470.1 cupin-like domain-containing protein [Massilia sp. YIM B02763]